MGERERFRLAQGLFAAAGQLGTSFQNEIAVLPAVFGMGGPETEASLRNGNWGDFKQRWDLWKAYALDPTIVSGFFLLRSNGATETKLWSWDGSAFIQATDQPLRVALSQATAERKRNEGFLNPAELGDGNEAFLLPLDKEREENRLWLAIRIDRAALTGHLLPLLAERFLYGKTDYYFRVVDQKDQSVVYSSSPGLGNEAFVKSDLRFPLLRSDFRVFSGRKEIPGPPSGSDKNDPILSLLKARKEVFSSQSDPDRGTANFMRDPFDLGRNEGARWVLEAVHRSGSLAAAVRSATLRSAIISGSILALMAVALIVLAIAVRRKQELTERQGEFIASVTHELKTPIAVIRSAADNLASGIIKDAERTRCYGNTIRNESSRLSEMIDRLLLYARVGDGSPMICTRIDLKELAADVLESYRDQLSQAQFRVDFQARQVFVTADAAALKIALGNLIANVLKHALPGAFLGIELQEEGSWAVLSVRDKGGGVQGKEKKLIFDAFYRGEMARKLQLPGSGLGLNLVRRIVIAHGGSLSLAVQGELGSTFIIRVPISRENLE
ncbi:hypothetical protein MASR2M78_10250 [Treponema sp.]